MALGLAKILEFPPIESHYEFTKRDTILYALGVGANELKYTYEESLEAFPTMAMVMGYPGFIWRDPRYGVDWKRVLHGESSLRVHRKLPVEGHLFGITRLGPIFDKGSGKGAVCYWTREVYDDAGMHLATVGAAIVLRGDGGFGGSSEGQPRPPVLPERPADLEHSLGTLPTQALTYRLSGDLNPIHVDPEIAIGAGFPRPILHGLCTYAIAARSILISLCANEPSQLRQINARFTSPVFPGETIRTLIWQDGSHRAFFRSLAEERGTVVLDNGVAEFG